VAPPSAGQQNDRSGRLAVIGRYFKLLVSRDTPWTVRLVMLAALAYLLFPQDLIPDWLLGIGIIDDLGIVTLLTWVALKIIDRSTQAANPKRTFEKHEPGAPDD